MTVKTELRSWSNQCWQLHADCQCRDLDASRDWLQCLQPWKHLKWKTKNRRKNPPSGTPTLLIHWFLLVQCIPGVTAIKCCSLVGLMFPRMPFDIAPDTTWISWRVRFMSASSRIYFSPHVVVTPRGKKNKINKSGEEQHTRYVSTGAAAVLFHSVFRGGFFL